MKLYEFFETPFEFGAFDAGSIVFSFARLCKFICTGAIYTSGLESGSVWRG